VNVYYDPKECGLEQVATLDEDGLSYEYNTLLVVRDVATGRVFYAQDSGCSCPTPFEDYHFRGSDDTNLDEVTAGNFEGFQRSVEGFPAPQDERGILIDKTREALERIASAA
jgi:hypothetical protein